LLPKNNHYGDVEDVVNKIKVGWFKRKVLEYYVIHKIPMKLNKDFYKMAI